MSRQKGKRAKKRSKRVSLVMKPDAMENFYANVLTLQEEEKKRISRDLHDETGQVIVGLGASFNIVEKELEEGNVEKALKVIRENRELIKELANKMKSMALRLRPPALDVLGLSAILRDYFWQCSQSTQVRIEFTENIKDTKLNENIEISVYRIAQEAVFNVLKHAEAVQVKVDLLLSGNALRLIVEDNGKGFDVEEYNRQLDSAKLGLRGIRERVDILKGEFSIESSIGKGTKLIATIPL